MDFQEVSAVSTLTVQLTGPSYPTYSPLGYCKFRTGSTATPYNPPGNVRLRFDVTATYDSPTTFDTITFTHTAGHYTIASAASHISGTDYPSGWSPTVGVNSISFTRTTPGGSTSGTFYVRLAAVNQPDGTDTTWTVTTSGGTGPHPAAVTATSTRDETPPSLRLKYTGITAPKVEEANFTDILGKGTMNILMYVNEPVYATPTMSVRQSGASSATSLSLTAQTTIPSATWLSSTYTIINTTNDGVAQVLPSVYDLAGNQADNSNIREANSSIQSDGPTFIVDTLCNAPSLTSPLDGTFTQTGNEIKFKWSAITEQASEYVTYNLQWAKNNTFTTELTSISAQCNESSSDVSQRKWKSGTGIPPWSPSNTLIINPTYTWRGYNTSSIDVGTWYWRVKAIDALGNESAWSSYRSFSRSGTGTDAPTFRIRYIKTPKIEYDTTPDVVGAGSLQIKIYASEVLQ
ncbi:MAG: hypothetical protein GYA60_00435, partial [Candidatus Methanofastidiosa archaeon]|nr:hypothetical protein [Candidatus Methanofastidiosa archaeon]